MCDFTAVFGRSSGSIVFWKAEGDRAIADLALQSWLLLLMDELIAVDALMVFSLLNTSYFSYYLS